MILALIWFLAGKPFVWNPGLPAWLGVLGRECEVGGGEWEMLLRSLGVGVECSRSGNGGGGVI